MTRIPNPKAASRWERRQSKWCSRLLFCLFLFVVLLLGVAVRMALMDVRGSMMIRSSPCCGAFRPRCCRAEEVDLLMVVLVLRFLDREDADGLWPMVTTADFRCSVTILCYQVPCSAIDLCRFFGNITVNTVVSSHNHQKFIDPCCRR